MVAPSRRRVPLHRRHALRWGVRLLVRFFSRTEIRGIERLPRGPTIVAPNHLGHADPALMLAALPAPPEIIALSDLTREPIAPLLRLYDPLLVNRDEYDRAVVKEALASLSRDDYLLLFPEARISVTGALETARGGVGYLALRAGVPVVPVALTGTERVRSSLLAARRPVLSVTIGDPIRPVDVPAGPARERRAWITAELMTRIAALLPPAYRGVYARCLPGVD